MESSERAIRRRSAVAGKVLALLWAGWWTFFAVAVVTSEGGNPVNILRFGWFLTILPLGMALIALRWDKPGGILLVIAGVAAAVLYPLLATASLGTIVFMFLAMAAPPLAAGIMLLLGSRRGKESTT